jgi:hypothetical protein
VPHIGAEAPQVAGRGRRRSGPPGVDDLRADPDEGIGGHGQGADLPELGDLVQQRVQADVPGVGLDPRQDRLDVLGILVPVADDVGVGQASSLRVHPSARASRAATSSTARSWAWCSTFNRRNAAGRSDIMSA